MYNVTEIRKEDGIETIRVCLYATSKFSTCKNYLMYLRTFLKKTHTPLSKTLQLNDATLSKFSIRYSNSRGEKIEYIYCITDKGELIDKPRNPNRLERFA